MRLQTGLANSSTFILKLLMTENKYCRSLPPVCLNLHSTGPFEVLPCNSCAACRAGQIWDNSWEYPDNATRHRPEFKHFKCPKVRETFNTLTGAASVVLLGFVLLFFREKEMLEKKMKGLNKTVPPQNKEILLRNKKVKSLISYHRLKISYKL